MLSLIIPTRRKGETLKRCLDSVAEHTSDYELVVVDGQGGFAKKLNQGIKQAKGDYLIFLHDDCEVTRGWTNVLAEVGAFCLGERNDSFHSWGGFVNPPDYCNDPSLNPDYAYFCCIAKKAMKKIGLLDEKFVNPFYQDVDFGLQVKKAGYKYHCLPGKIIHHNGEDSGAPDERQRFYLERKWGVKL
ncbi:MAG: glycosyltransferase [Blastocatellia bacterium]|nr:glycosyltransferase [Blastocatellia bacterium]